MSMRCVKESMMMAYFYIYILSGNMSKPHLSFWKTRILKYMVSTFERYNLFLKILKYMMNYIVLLPSTVWQYCDRRISMFFH